MHAAFAIGAVLLISPATAVAGEIEKTQVPASPERSPDYFSK
jgi:hypothetical protein